MQQNAALYSVHIRMHFQRNTHIVSVQFSIMMMTQYRYPKMQLKMCVCFYNLSDYQCNTTGAYKKRSCNLQMQCCSELQFAQLCLSLLGGFIDGQLSLLLGLG